MVLFIVLVYVLENGFSIVYVWLQLSLIHLYEFFVMSNLIKFQSPTLILFNASFAGVMARLTMALFG